MPGLSSAYTHEGDPRMTRSLQRIQRGITTATETPARLKRTKVTSADPAEEREGVEPAADAAVSGEPVLITEQEVMFSTAAVVTVPSKKTAGARIALLRLRRPFTSSTPDERAAKHRHYPHHYVFLEQALMAREMGRL
jgi:hypothetical protein